MCIGVYTHTIKRKIINFTELLWSHVSSFFQDKSQIHWSDQFSSSMSIPDVHSKIPVQVYRQNNINVFKNAKRIIAFFSWVSVISLQRILLNRTPLNILNISTNWKLQEICQRQNILYIIFFSLKSSLTNVYFEKINAEIFHWRGKIYTIYILFSKNIY